MKQFFRVVRRSISVIAISSVLATSAHAVIIYDFAGSCTNGCSGGITGSLSIVDSFVPGGSTNNIADFVSFAIQGGFISRVANSPSIVGFAFSDGPPSPALDIRIMDSFNAFVIETAVMPMRIGPDFSGPISVLRWTARVDRMMFGGNISTFAQRPSIDVPTPSTWMLLSLGLIGLGCMRMRRPAR